MKKEIELINMNPELLKSLNNYFAQIKNDKLNTDEIKTEELNTVEFEKALSNLEKGLTSCLVLENADNKSSTITEEGLDCGKGLVIYYKSRKVIKDNIKIVLTPKEFDILYFLAKNRGEVFTKEQIYQAVWEDNYLLDDSNIMAFIRKLRKKIEENPDDPQFILTIWGIGYKFNDNL